MLIKIEQMIDAIRKTDKALHAYFHDDNITYKEWKPKWKQYLAQHRNDINIIQKDFPHIYRKFQGLIAILIAYNIHYLEYKLKDVNTSELIISSLLKKYNKENPIPKKVRGKTPKKNISKKETLRFLARYRIRYKQLMYQLKRHLKKLKKQS